MADLIVSINDLTHPLYARRYPDWLRWRDAYIAGANFLEKYMEKYSDSEEAEDFKKRKKISYVPAFAKSNLTEVINSIYQRLGDITRVGGSAAYQEAVKGNQNGVDLLGSNMNTFMGTEVLPEMAVMGQVGIYVDMPPKAGETLIENQNKHPYLYVYKVEDIRSWQEDDSCEPNHFKAVLLRDHVYTYDKIFGLPNGEDCRYRFFWKNESGEVWVKFYSSTGEPVDINGTPSDTQIQLNISRIPFVYVDLGCSLMQDIDRYQVALMNLASADMRYAVSANFPFYVEQFDPRYEAMHVKKPLTIDDNGSVTPDAGNTTPTPPTQQVAVGPNSGRRYPINTNAPSFIHPSAEPMKASMDKQEQLKLEIRLLLNLAISNIQPKMASADSKGMDERTLESGLAYIGLLLEDAERQICLIWAEYEGTKDVATVAYPRKYSLKTDEQRRAEVADLKEQSTTVPSDSYRREIMKEIVRVMLESKVEPQVLKKIYDEIDKAPVAIVDPEQLVAHAEAGFIDSETASQACGYPKGVVEKAQKEKADRLKMIQESQAPKPGSAATDPALAHGAGSGNPAARGTPDAAADPALAAKLEKQNKDGTLKPQRGKGK